MMTTEKLRDEELIASALCSEREIKYGYADINGNVGECNRLLMGLADNTDLMNRAKDATPQREVVSYKKLIAPIIIFFRKLIRKFVLKWYIEPICDRQTLFNTASFNAMREMEKIAQSQTMMINELIQKNAVLSEALQGERSRSDLLEKRIAELENNQK